MAALQMWDKGWLPDPLIADHVIVSNDTSLCRASINSGFVIFDHPQGPSWSTR